MEIIIVIESIILAVFGLAIINMSKRIRYIETNRIDVDKLENRIQQQNAAIFNAVMNKVDDINPNKPE